MDSLAIRRRVDLALQRSREARAAGDGPGCVAALDDAFAAAREGDDAELAVALGWRLAKAHHDFGTAREMLEGLRPLLELPDPFSGYDAALKAVEPIVRRAWDELGYGAPLVPELCEAWSRAHQERHDPYLAAYGQQQKAWLHACRGERDALRAIVDRYARLTPDGFGDGPHRHARAEDTPSSLWFVQMDLGHTLLRGSTWAARERDAQDALDVYLDAAEDAGVEPDLWFRDAAVHAAARFGWARVREEHERPWLDALDRLDHPRAAYHRAAARALVRGEADTLVDAARLAEEGRYGPEWAIAALIDASRLDPQHPGAPGWRERAAELTRRYEVRVFESPA